MKAWIVAIVGAGILTACGDSRQTPKTVFDDQVGALKKAEAVNGKVQENTDALRQAVDASTGKPAGDQ
jgi:hypothetical protein